MPPEIADVSVRQSFRCLHAASGHSRFKAQRPSFNGQMWVMGGAFNLISNEVDVYDPSTNTWSLGPPFATARRNFPTDTDGTSRIWLAGGYDSTILPLASMEIFTCQPSPTPTPTPTVTPTATPTPTVTPTPTPGQIVLTASERRSGGERDGVGSS